VLEDITADLLPKDQYFDLPSTPAQTETRRTGQANDAAPHAEKVPTVELGPVVEAMAKLEKSVTVGFTSLITMVESNARAIRNLEKTLGTHLLQISKSLDRLSERNARSRKDDDFDRRPEKRLRLDEHEKENRPTVKSTVNKPNRK
jgi:formiminotetrahydrofolate cyclodeaminase